MGKNIADKVSEINGVHARHSRDLDGFLALLERAFGLSALAQRGRSRKRRGASVALLFLVVTVVPALMYSTVRAFLASQFACLARTASKFAIHRFMNNPIFNWRKVMYLLNRKIKRRDGTAGALPTALILDDTLLEKAGRRIEGVSLVHDHCDGKHKKGFKLLALAFFNGAYTRTLDFALVAETAFKVTRPFRKQRPAESSGAGRKKELGKDKITLAGELVRRAVREGFKADYLMFDSWYTCAELITLCRRLAKGTMHVLGMVKDGKRKYLLGGKRLTLGEMRKSFQAAGQPKYCRRFNAYYYETVCEIPGAGTVNIFFSKLGRRGKWVAILTTNLRLDYTRAVELYAIRWSIEVLFKESKGLLGLGKCQANDFDAQIAHSSCVLMQHAMLGSVKNAEEYRTLGELFREQVAREGRRILVERLLELFEDMLRTVAAAIGRGGSATLTDIFSAPEYAACMQCLFGQFLHDGGFAPCKKAA
jgi:hypothetical protein